MSGKGAGVCTLPHTVWGSGYIHSACGGEMAFKVTLVRALRTIRTAAMLLVNVQRCTSKSSPVRHTSQLHGAGVSCALQR